jgi:hypothetical protein
VFPASKNRTKPEVIMGPEEPRLDATGLEGVATPNAAGKICPCRLNTTPIQKTRLTIDLSFITIF